MKLWSLSQIEGEFFVAIFYDKKNREKVLHFLRENI